MSSKSKVHRKRGRDKRETEQLDDDGAIIGAWCNELPPTENMWEFQGMGETVTRRERHGKRQGGWDKRKRGRKWGIRAP